MLLSLLGLDRANPSHLWVTVIPILHVLNTAVLIWLQTNYGAAESTVMRQAHFIFFNQL